MSSITPIIETAFRLFAVAEVTARYVALCTLVVGIIGYWTAGSNVRQARRCQGMVVGACAALGVIFGLTTFYELVAYVMAGTDFLPPGWPYGAGAAGELRPLAQIASGMLAFLGLAWVSLGAALWAASSPGGQTRIRGKRGVIFGLVMIGVSMGGTLFTVFASVFPSI